MDRRGEGIHWPDLDEDISVEGLLAGLHTPTRFSENDLAQAKQDATLPTLLVFGRVTIDRGADGG